MELFNSLKNIIKTFQLSKALKLIPAPKLKIFRKVVEKYQCPYGQIVELFCAFGVGGYFIQIHRTLIQCLIGVTSWAIGVCLVLIWFPSIFGWNVFFISIFKNLKDRRGWNLGKIAMAGLFVLIVAGASFFFIRHGVGLYLMVSFLVLGVFFFLMKKQFSALWIKSANASKLWYQQFPWPSALIILVISFFLFFSWGLFSTQFSRNTSHGFELSKVGKISPMESYNSLVAGNEEAGFQDGEFQDAFFKNPAALVFDKEGKRLFVADKDNHRIRVVHIDDLNRVDTLTGKGMPGNNDGSLAAATFNFPSVMAALPDNRLAVCDWGSQTLRFIDLKHQVVTTLGTGPDGKGKKVILGIVWNMAYCSKDNCLYLTLPDAHCVDKIDLKDLQVSQIISQNPNIPSPKALCLDGDKIYVADKDLPTIYTIETKANVQPSQTIDLVDAGKGDHILEMAASEGRVYALQSGVDPLAMVFPNYKPVSLATPWGFFLENDNPGYTPLMRLSKADPIGFVISSVEKRKLFVTLTNRIVSIKDYDFEKLWNVANVQEESDHRLTDFRYPTEKPPRTFRILVSGSSMVMMSPEIIPGVRSKDPNFQAAYQASRAIRTDLFAKKLELLLNAQSTLHGSNVHFEVLVLGQVGVPPQYFGIDLIPSIVRKYDVDMTILLETPDQEGVCYYYFEKPLTSDGIPAMADDPEFMLKPWKERVSSGLPADLAERCLKDKLAAEESPIHINFSEFYKLLEANDKKIRDDLVELTARPIGVLAQKVKALKTDAGDPVKFLVCYVPTENVGKQLEYRLFWNDVLNQSQVEILDLSDPFTAFQVSCYPTNEACCNEHFTGQGNWLVAYLLNYYLWDKKYLPVGKLQ